MSEDTFMNESVLSERREKSDDHAKEIGPLLCSKLVRLLKSGTMFSIQHDQTAEAAKDLAGWINEELEETGNDSLSLQMSEHNFFIDGALIGADERSHERLQKLRETFAVKDVNILEFKAGITSGELLKVLDGLDDAEQESLDGFSSPHLELALVADRVDEMNSKADERRQILELYAGLLVRCQMYFGLVRAGGNPTTRGIKRLVQRVTDRVADYGDVFIGLIHMKLLHGHDFVHASNCAIYAMILADAVGLGKLDIVRCGMTAIAQDIDKLEREQPAKSMDIGDESHFQTNLNSVTSLSQTGTRDVLSALRLVTNYERGFPYNRPLPTAWYEDQLQPHLLSRIVEIGRDYDVLTQGMEGFESMKPDLALQSLMDQMGTHYDPLLVKLFVNALGVYPVGSVVRLSDGRKGLVIRNAPSVGKEALSNATRPVVRLLDGTEQIVDLSRETNSRLNIERILEDDEIESRPGAFLLF